jgi:hypothetical protein
MNAQENPHRENPEPAGKPEQSSPEPPPRMHGGAPVGQRVSGINQRNRKSPALAALLSLMPGLGQVYVGYYHQGFVNMAIVAIAITVLNAEISALEPLFGFGLSFFWFYNMIDAHRRARMYNLALSGESEIPLPKDFRLPQRGSLWGGLALIVVGFLVFLNTKFDVSMDWIEEWWPLLVIGVGVYLLARHIKGRQD